MSDVEHEPNDASSPHVSEPETSPVPSDAEPETNVDADDPADLTDVEPEPEPPSLSELWTTLETKRELMSALRTDYRSALFAFESARQLYKELYAETNPENPLPDLDAFPDAESLQIELDQVKDELARAKTEVGYLAKVREARLASRALSDLRDNWDETADGPIPEPLEPVALDVEDPEDDRTEHDRLMEAYAKETARVQKELGAYRASAHLLDTTKTGIRKRAARARASGSIDPVGFYTDLADHFGDAIGLSPGNLMNVFARDDQGRTPLACVVGCGLSQSEPHPERLGRTNTLLGMGSEVDAKDHDGNTALGYAVAEPDGDPELVRLLIAHGADPFSKNAAGQTVLERARSFALRAILFDSTGELRHRISKTLTGEQAKNMTVFVEDPHGAAELFRELLHRFG